MTANFVPSAYDIMIVDYYLVKKEKLDIQQLFSSALSGFGWVVGAVLGGLIYYMIMPRRG